VPPIPDDLPPGHHDVPHVGGGGCEHDLRPGERASEAHVVQPHRDGRFVSFSSKATNLVPAQPEPEPGHAHVFRYDHQAKVLDVVSVPASGKGGGFMSAMSQNGAVLAFDSAAAGFVANDSNDTYDIFVQQR